jgi:hypothetical protein
MEKLMFISKDSIFAGSILSKTAEIIDSLATVLTGDYDVYIVTINSGVMSLARKTASLKILDENKQKIKFSKVTYYLVTEESWDDEVEKIINDWRMSDCTFYVTKEPCPMCAGMLTNARVKRVVFGVSDPAAGGMGGAFDLNSIPGLLWHCEVTGGVMAEESLTLIRDFFRRRRIEK